MDLTHGLIAAIRTPDFVLNFEDLVCCSDGGPSTEPPTCDPFPPLYSPTEVEEFFIRSSFGWRVDGSTNCGTRFFLTPGKWWPDAYPLRVDVSIPDQAQHPAQLRAWLGSHASAACRDSSFISKLGISKYLCRVLDYCCETRPGWLDHYQTLPFGSTIRITNINLDVKKAVVEFIPSYEIEKKAKSVPYLQKAWAGDLPPQEWPEEVSLQDLRLHKQVHDSISIVGKAGKDNTANRTFIFKSSTTNLTHVYHELKLLLTIPPHQHLMPRPVAVVVKRSLFGAKLGILGFLLPYFPHGSIRDKIPHGVSTGSLTIKTRLRWCREIASALHHMVAQGHMLYSDLRPDNVLLSQSTTRSVSVEGSIDPSDVEQLSIVLCDLEQRGNWHEWCAPEVRYAQYAENLKKHQSSQADLVCRQLIELYDRPKSKSCPTWSNVDQAVRAKNWPWFRLSEEAAEKALVYSFGLMLYCIFEGLHNCCVNIANSFPGESRVEFPSFKRTPPPLRQLVVDCTVDAAEWQMCCSDSTQGTRSLCGTPTIPLRVVRIGSHLFPEGAEGKELGNMSTTEIREITLRTAYDWWKSELDRATEFFKRPEWQHQDLGTRRPGLKEVLDRLERIEGEIGGF